MKIFTSVIIVLFFLYPCSAQSQKSYALTNVNLFNGFENKIFYASVVYVSAGKTERIGKQGDAISKEYEII